MTVNWITTLFDATDFLPRGHCGPWPDSLKLLYIVSNIVLALADLLIAASLQALCRRRRHDIQFGWIVSLFATFIAVGGLTHLFDIAVLWWPAYRLFTLISAIAAIISMFTALLLPRVTKILSEIPSLAVFQEVNRELESAIALKEEAINELGGTVAALRRQVAHLERMRQTGLWVAEQESALRELKTVLASSSTKETSR